LFKNQYIIVDDFYEYPDAINALAKSMSTEESTGGNYGGVMTDEQFFNDSHKQIFNELSGIEVIPSTQLTGKFRFTTKYDKAGQHIHFDPGHNQIWSAVIFMEKEPEGATEEDLKAYGTHFWKHNRTGLTSIPHTQEGIEEYGWKGVDDLKVFLETEGNDQSLWTRQFSVPYKYNRLVMFRPWLFHSPGDFFGEDKSNCRLIQTFFLGYK
jgi:hypothetical protein